MVHLNVARSRRERGCRAMRRGMGLPASVASQLGYIAEAWLEERSRAK